MKSFLALAATVAVSIASPARAERPVMVQCQIGSLGAILLDYVCDAFNAGYAKLTPIGTDGKLGNGILPCAEEISHHLVGNQGDFISVCTRLTTAAIITKLDTGHRSDYDPLNDCIRGKNPIDRRPKPPC